MKAAEARKIRDDALPKLRSDHGARVASALEDVYREIKRAAQSGASSAIVRVSEEVLDGVTAALKEAGFVTDTIYDRDDPGYREGRRPRLCRDRLRVNW